MIATAKKHKKLAATVLVGTAVLGGGVSYLINYNTNRIEQTDSLSRAACQGANSANQTLIDVLQAAEAGGSHTPEAHRFYLILEQTAREHIKSC